MTMQFAQHPHAVRLHYHAGVARNWKNSTLAERVAYVMETEGWTEAELARQIRAGGQSTVQQWTKGRNKTMQAKFAWRLHDKRKWNVRWLEIGEGEPKLPEPEDPEKEAILSDLRKMPADKLRAMRSLVTVP